MLPGHGAAIHDPAARLSELINHRHSREAQVLAALQAGPANAEDLAGQIYSEISAALLPAAARNILAHLIDLQARNRLTTPTPLTATSLFQTI